MPQGGRTGEGQKRGAMTQAAMPNKQKKIKIASRFRNINIFFLILILLVVTAVSAVMIFGIRDDASKDYARFYAAQAVEILGSYLNKELALVRQAVYSEEIIDWFADEDNPEKKAAAYREMMEYANLFQIGSLYFGIYKSLNEYSVNSGAQFKDFAHFDVLSPERLHDQWYFECINSINEYTLNIDVDKISKTRRLWINYKVAENGNLLGVFCSAFQFDEIFNELFGRYDSRNVIGYIVDELGIIQMDSSAEEPAPVYYDIEFYHAEEQRHILDVNSNSAFVSAINTHMGKLDGHYSQREEPEVIKLSGGPYRYLSIAPILNTSWLAVTFYNTRSLFNITLLLPPLLVILSAFMLYAAASSELIRRLVLLPLNWLTLSISKADRDTDGIYGAGRDDEIGELARTTRETWNRLNEYNASLHAQAAALNEAHEHAKLMLDAMPISCQLWNRNITMFGCNEKVVEIFQLRDKQEFMDRFFELSPKYQSDGQSSQEKAVKCIKEAFEYGRCVFEWMHQLLDGTPLPTEVTLVRVNYGDDVVVAGYIRDLREYKRIMNEIERRDQLLHTVNLAAAVLIDAGILEFEDSLLRCMEMMAEAVDADRVYIGKNYIYQGELHVTQIHEWSKSARPQQNGKYTTNVSYRNDLPGWEEILSKGQCINGLVRDMSPYFQSILSPQEILSIFIVPVFLQDHFWGVVGFDDCHRERVFSENEESILRSGCLLIGSAFLRHDNDTKIIRLQSALEEAFKEAQTASQAKSIFLANMSH